MSGPWSRFGYRPWARLLHRFGLHYARRSYMEDGSILHWCHWCGMRRREVPKKLTERRMSEQAEQGGER